jgi:hypothetical protein
MQSIRGGQQRRNHRPLSGPLVADRHDLVFENARLQPFPDQADDALVADAMFDEADEPFLAHRIEELLASNIQFTFRVMIPTTSASIASCAPRSGRNP